MPVAVGQRLGPYEVQALIGAGGMGEVYRAIDTRLNRIVALKVLPQNLASDPDRRARFAREAQTIAALNHPHICTLHDLGEADGVTYLVMEHVAGETLAQRLKKGPLPLDLVLRLGADIADALHTAHRKGIIHRDLKPANVMVTSTGAKLLDFGLARLTGQADRAVVAELAPATTTAGLTGRGTILGTLQYMAPEQLEGKEADARTDIWALGVLLYEMLTGRPAFEAASSAGLIAAIVEREPVPISATQPLTPPTLERLVRKCLAKQPDARWQSAADAADELRWVASGSGGKGQVPAPRAHRRRRWLSLATAMLLIGSVGVVWWARSRPVASLPVHVTYRQVTFSGDVVAAALSPDGRTGAYAVGDEGGQIRVLVRDLTGGPALEIWKGRDLGALSWTPDGTQILLSAGEESGGQPVWLVSRFGGEPRRLAAINAPYVAMSPDGVWVAGAWPDERGFRVVPVNGGKPQPVRLPGVQWVHDLRWGPGGQRLAVRTRDEDGSYAVWTVARDGSTPRRIYAVNKEQTEQLSMCWSPGPDHVFVQVFRNGTTDLLRVTDTDRAATPEVVLRGIPLATSCDVSRHGQRLLQVRPVNRANLWAVDLRQPSATPRAITQRTSAFGDPDISPDGHSIAVTHDAGLRREVVRIPLAGGEPTILNEGAQPKWSPDGRRLAFIAGRGERERVWVSDADGQQAYEIKDAKVGNLLILWLPDGRLAWQTPDARNYRIRDLATGREESLVPDPSIGWVFNPQFSPNGELIAVWWNRKEGGLWTLSWPQRVGRRVVEGRLWPFGWSADGRWIYALKFADQSARTKVLDIVKVSAESGHVESFSTLSNGNVSGCDVSGDERTLICAVEQSSSDAWLVEHLDPRRPPPSP